MPAERRRESTRKPICPDLPEEVRTLLQELERLADAAKVGFPKIIEEISRDGEKLSPPYVTRWRQGVSFPSKDAVRRWTEFCDGDVQQTERLYANAEPVYQAWKDAGGRRGNRSPEGRFHAPVPTVRGDTPGDAERFVVDRTTPGVFLRRPRRTHLLIAVVTALVVGFAAGVGWFVGGGDQPKAGPEFAVPPCSWKTAARAAVPSVTAAPGHPAPLMYKVPSGLGSHDVAVLADGFAMQPFQATAPRIDQVSAIIGIDPKRSNPNAAHPVRFEVLQPQQGRPPRLLGSADTAVTPQNDNKDVVAPMRPVVEVTTGQVYVLRVTNRSQDPVGIYVNSLRGPNRAVPYAAQVCMRDSIEPFTSAGFVLSGFISGVT
jgi:hypothetical protein